MLGCIFNGFIALGWVSIGIQGFIGLHESADSLLPFEVLTGTAPWEKDDFVNA